ncbi:MAG: GIY-YIG nuclease family protein [Candidatus Falkowbacteria bacterium]|nr:MAG: GIY-YIG nuclease family protein [Candidatus Falkowbacteria bacterium]
MSRDLSTVAKSAPKQPGVYFWRDKKGNVLYVGRATSLKARLSQYFQNGISSRIAEMVAAAADLRWETTDNLLEAIILEATNIKKYWPKYNIVDRDDRSFIYVVIPKKEFARPIIIRGHELKKFPAGTAQVFGPYQSYYLLQNALRLIRRIFPYGTCKPNSGRACFDYQIGLCPGACAEKISAREYKKNIDNIILLLKGEKKRLLVKLKKANPEQAKALQHLQDVSLLTRDEDLNERKISRLEGYDISHHAGKESYGSMVVFENGEPNTSQYRLFKIKDAPGGDDERSLLEVLTRRFKHLEWPLPDLIMIDGGSPQISFLTRELAKLNISVQMVGISKFGGDKLVFSTKTKKEQRELAENIKATLLKLREEAHRFANRGRKAGLKAKTKGKY